MKNQNKLFLMAIMLIGIATVTNTFAQTLGKFGRGNGSNFVDSSTPIFEDITNSRIGIGTLSPSKTLTVSGDANVTGSFGIGTTSLSNKLEVNGDINVASSNGYKIGNSTLPVLWHNGNPVNLFVGDGAGNTTLTSSSYTTLVGYNAGHALSDGHTNTYVGYNSGSLGLHGYSNTGVGFQALKKTEAYGGCAFGLNAAFSNVGGCSLIAVGENALYKNFTGNDNSAIGHYAMYNNTELGDNIAIGDAALFTQDWAPPSGTCPDNPTYGYPTGCKSSNNVAVGNKALWWNNPTSTGVDPTNGINNSALGTLALYNNRNGYGNTANGYYAGYTNQTGYNNTFLGFNTDVGTYNLNNAAAIGANAITKNSNEMILGDPSVYVGIGYSGVAAFPPGKLSVDENAGKVPTPTIAGFFHNGDVTTDATYTFQKKAVYAYCDGLFANESGGWFLTNIGGDFEAGNAEESNIAIRGTTGRLHVESNGLYGYGGVFEAVRSANDNIGVWTSSDGSGRNTNYGIYASAPIGTCHDGGAGSCTDAAGYFNGDVYTTSHAYFTSDANLKDNI